MKPLRLAVLGCAAVVLSSSADVSAQRGADSVTRPAPTTPTGACASVAAAFDQALVNVEAEYFALTHACNADIESLPALLRSLSARVAADVAKISALDAKIAAMDVQIASLQKTCVGTTAAFSPCTKTLRKAVADREAAASERASVVDDRDSANKEIKEIPGTKAALEAEQGHLTNDLATAQRSLAAQRAKALLQCAQIQQQAVAITRFCGGKMLGEATRSTVVLVGGTPAGAQAIASVDRSLGLVRISLPALSGNATVDKAGAVGAALDQAAGKGLLIDGGSAFLQTAGSRTERGGRSIVSSTLDAVPRLVIVHLDGPVGERERAAATARGWRVAPDGEDGVRIAACTR